MGDVQVAYINWRRSFFHWPRLRLGEENTMLDLLQVDLS